MSRKRVAKNGFLAIISTDRILNPKTFERYTIPIIRQKTAEDESNYV